MRGPSLTLALFVLCAVWSWSPAGPPALAGVAIPDVNVELRGNARVRGTVRPLGEIELFVVPVPGGATVDLDVVAKSASLAPDVGLLLGGTAVEPGQVPLRTLRETSRGLQLRGLEVAASDTFVVRMAAGGVGEYDLSVRTHPKLRWRVVVAPEEGPRVAPAFSAPLGSAALLIARAAKGSDADPVIASVDGLDTTALGKRKGGKHSLSLSAAQLAPQLDHFVTVQDLSGNGGAIQLDVVVQTGGVPRDRFDLRGAALGLPRGGEAVVSRIVAPESVGLVDTDSRLGLAWEAPRFARPVRMSLQPATVQPHEVTGGWTAVADGWRFDTEGERSARGIELRLPLPLGMARAPRDAVLDDLAVLVLPDDGAPEIVSPGDRNESRVRVWTLRPGRYVVVAPEGPGRVHGSSYWMAGAMAALRRDPGNDSRERQALSFAGRIDYEPDRDGGACPLVQRVTTVDFDITPRPGAGVTTRSEVQSIPYASWEYDAEEPGRILAGNGWRYAVSSGGAYAVAVAGDSQESVLAGFDLQVRRDLEWRSFDQLSGTWDLLAHSIEAAPGGDRVEVGAGRSVGVLTIDDVGAWRLVGRMADVVHDGSAVRASKARKLDLRGTARKIAAGDPLEGGFELVFETPGGDEGTLTCLPGAGGRAFVGRGPFGPDHEAVFVALWRGPQLARLGGDWVAGSLDLGVVGIDLDSVPAGDWEIGIEGGMCDLEGPPPAAFHLTLPHRPFARRDPSVDGGVLEEWRAQSSRDGSWRQNLRDGAIELRDGERTFVGAADAAGEILVFVDAPTSRSASGVFGTLVRR